MERRLAAVMIADVVGYGRLSQADEEDTRARFQADLDEVFERQIASHRGRLVKTMGDGILVEFHSVVDALRCAVEIQQAKAERNAADLPDRRLDFRIGINLGDVLIEGDDIHGDGVNIADRLQALAEPGGVAISGTAYDQVKAKLPVGYASLGEQKVKSIAEPVRVYRVLLDPAAAGMTIDSPGARRRFWRVPATAAAILIVMGAIGGGGWIHFKERIEPARVERMELPLPDKPSIAVLPFTNMSDDPKQDYFADGITDDVITDLSKLSGLFVISRNSTFVYKGKAMPPGQIAEELGVRYVLEGSVQRAGDKLRINAQLIDTVSGGHKWADRFDGSLADVFALQDRVTQAIAAALAVNLTAAEKAAVGQEETKVPEAYNALLEGMEHYYRGQGQANELEKAVELLTRATELDPDYARAYAALSYVYMTVAAEGWWDSLGVSEVEARTRAREYLVKSQRRPTAFGLEVSAFLLWEDGQPEKAFVEYQKAAELDPSDAAAYAFMGVSLTSAGRPAEALPFLDKAMRFDPHYPAKFDWFLGVALLGLQRYQEAADALERAVRLNPNNENPQLFLAAVYGLLGKRESGAAAIDRANALKVARGGIPYTVHSAPAYSLQKSRDRRRFWDGLRAAGMPEILLVGDFAEANQLSHDEARSLLFGHNLHGRSPLTGEERAALINKDGLAVLSGDWGSFDGRATKFERDQVCFTAADGDSLCGVLFRNPGGTRAHENEAILFTAGGSYTFSQID